MTRPVTARVLDRLHSEALTDDERRWQRIGSDSVKECPCGRTARDRREQQRDTLSQWGSEPEVTP